MPVSACKKVGKGLCDYRHLYKMLLGIVARWNQIWGVVLIIFFPHLLDTMSLCF